MSHLKPLNQGCQDILEYSRSKLQILVERGVLDRFHPVAELETRVDYLQNIGIIEVLFPECEHPD